MSSRRVPLSNNATLANSPLRGGSALAQATKRIRSHAELQREEAYGQPPPSKRQMLEQGSRALGSPTRSRVVRLNGTRPVASKASVGADKASQATTYKPTDKELDNIRQWQAQTRSRFPKMVFYFESIPDDVRVKLAKQVTQLGAREEKFFSIDITHVVTTRPIPSEKALQEIEANANPNIEQPKTIDPSLLNRNADFGASSIPTKRKLLFDTASSRRHAIQTQDEVIKMPKTRNTDILHKARDMGKKIWSLEKIQKILDNLEPDAYKATASRANAGTGSKTEQSNLLQMLQNERIHGPSDRDPTVVTQEIHYFKGPFIYVFDIEEKTKPVMVREYAKVQEKKDGDWPQFRTASQGRCPFIEDDDRESRAQARVKERVAKAPVEAAAPSLKPTEAPAVKPVTGKRSLAEMEDSQSQAKPASRIVQNFEQPSTDFRVQNAFMSRAKAGRLVAGEPVASGMQASHVTSAIRSQMISSTTGVLGAKAGTSKEMHGLQRKVLQKASTPLVSQDLSSRRMAEMSHDSNTFIRSQSLGRSTHRKLDLIDEDDTTKEREKLRRTVSAPTQQKQKKRDPKPGYCENCQDKFDDFDDHILSRKHRKFAEHDDNWSQLDSLLDQLERQPKYSATPRYEDEGDEWL
ncbi:hypothetical protein GQ53DRAFT_655653 [Thozetella sp. PMI_491]|nr:hypothetical protein GQ53DRAFT_655653 [Thozetella sp. PMI_491]